MIGGDRRGGSGARAAQPARNLRHPDPRRQLQLESALGPRRAVRGARGRGAPRRPVGDRAGRHARARRGFARRASRNARGGGPLGRRRADPRRWRGGERLRRARQAAPDTHRLFADSAAAAAAIAGVVQAGDLWLVKGSRGIRMERLVETAGGPAGATDSTRPTSAASPQKRRAGSRAYSGPRLPRPRQGVAPG